MKDERSESVDDLDVRILSKCDHAQAWNITSGHSIHAPVNGPSSFEPVHKYLIIMMILVVVF